MANCINKNHPDVIKMAEELNVLPAVLSAKIGLWQTKNNIIDRFPTADELNNSNEINQTLKAVDILQSDKAKQVFEKGKKNNWSLDKILTELQIPKEQKQLILDLGITDREQIVLELTSNYSYTVEINTAKSLKDPTHDFEEPYTDEDEYLARKKESEEKGIQNTQYYSKLTVPGGTNYTENEIATPAITPSIKGHAQFATDNGIGWFRSDDKYPFTGFLEDLIASGTIKKVPCG